MKNGSVSILRCFFFTSQSTSQKEVEITINCVTGLFALNRKLACSNLLIPGHSYFTKILNTTTRVNKVVHFNITLKDIVEQSFKQ